MSNKICLKYQNLKDVDGLSRYTNLWIVDLSDNMIECVRALGSCVALGSLNLSNNRLSWASLEYIKELYLIYLDLHGNMTIDNDQHYREQIIDTFPRLFCLDGKFINARERDNVRLFFETSRFDKYPIRKHIKRDCFRSTSCKNLRLFGKFGKEAFQFLSKFPNIIPLNEEWDKKKIICMAEFVVSDLISDMKQYKWILEWLDQLFSKMDHVHVISDLYVVLIVYFASIEFQLGKDLCQSALENNSLDTCIKFDLNSFFTLKLDEKIGVLSVFLAVLFLANKRDIVQTECVVELYHSMQNLLWVHIRINPETKIDNIFLKYKYKGFQNNYWLSRSLIAAETFMILSKVETSFEDLSNIAINEIINYATGRKHFLENLKLKFGTTAISNTLIVNEALPFIQSNVQVIFSSDNMLLFESNRIFKKSKKPSESSILKLIDSSEKLVRGKTTQGVKENCYRNTEKIMEIGSTVMLHSQIPATVLAVPQRNLALVQTQKNLIPNWKRTKDKIIKRNIEKVNPNSFIWDGDTGCWVPNDDSEDRYLLSHKANPKKESQKENSICKGKTIIDLSTVTLCDSNDFQENDDDHEDVIEKQPESKDFLREYEEKYKDNCSSRIISSKERKLMLPNNAKLDFDKINNCLKHKSLERSRSCFSLPTYSFPSASASVRSPRNKYLKDTRLWLGNGDVVHRSVWWNSNNPLNIMKKIHIPGWMDASIHRKSVYFNKGF